MRLHRWRGRVDLFVGFPDGRAAVKLAAASFSLRMDPKRHESISDCADELRLGASFQHEYDLAHNPWDRPRGLKR